MNIETVKLGDMDNNCYLLTDEASGDVAVVDPSFPEEPLLAALRERAGKIRYILLTHRHYDHVSGAAAAKRITGAPICIHELDAPGLTEPGESLGGSASLGAGELVAPDRLLRDGDVLPFGSGSIRVLHTPGHTPGGVCFLIGTDLFTGDTLFAGDVGRMDLPGGSVAQMIGSLAKLDALPGDYEVYPGHGGATTLDEERRGNRYFYETDHDAFNY